MRNKLNKKKQNENMSVIIRDLVIYPERQDFSYGEAKAHDNTYTYSAVVRLLDHLQSLSVMANQYHQQIYCELQKDGSYQLKEEHRNTITRLSLSEFSLYGKDPLTMAEFTLVVEALHQMAKNSHDNVHLLLSSFSVVDSNQRLLNVVVYVQGGVNAKLDTLSKGISSILDVTYDNTANFSQQSIEKARLSYISSYVVGETSDSSLIPNNSVFEIETKGGAKYIQAIDICVDHLNEHSKRLLLSRLDGDELNTTHFIPEQADHLVTSNFINISEEAKITPDVFHVHPKAPQILNRYPTFSPYDRKLVLTDASLSSIKINKYHSIQLTSNQKGLTVKNPPFGSSYSLVIYNERRLGGYTPEIAPLIDSMNTKIMDKRLDNMMIVGSVTGTQDVEEFHNMENMRNLTPSISEPLLALLPP